MIKPLDTESFINELKSVLSEVLDKVREGSRTNKHPLAQARYNAKWEMIDLLMLFLAKKETDMQKLKSDLIRQVISLDELEPIRKHSELEERIKEGVEALNQMMEEDKDLQKSGATLPGRSIKEDIEWGHFSAKISAMRTDGKIPNDITSAKRGDKFYLVKLPKGETVRPRKNRD